MEKVTLETYGHVSTITINRPERLNCFDYETLVELEKIVEHLHIDKSIRAVIISGQGEKAFSAGADLKERKNLSEQEVRRNVKKIRDIYTMIENLPQPTIAAINGYALGGGLELALVCDFRYAVEKAVLGLTEVSWAIIPGAGGTQRLPQLIGEAKAKEMIFTARRVETEEALDLGLIDKRVPREALMEKAEELAERITQNGPLAVEQAKYAINHGRNTNLDTGLAIEAKAYEVIIPTEDRIEALNAFTEKRDPAFKGR